MKNALSVSQLRLPLVAQGSVHQWPLPRRSYHRTDKGSWRPRAGSNIDSTYDKTRKKCFLQVSATRFMTVHGLGYGRRLGMDENRHDQRKDQAQHRHDGLHQHVRLGGLVERHTKAFFDEPESGVVHPVETNRS